MTILGFKLSKKHIIIIGVVLVLFLIISQASRAKKLEEVRRRNEEALNQQQQSTETNPYDGLSDAEIEQLGYIEEWGQPAQGFRWNYNHELVPISSDDLTNEDVIWSYLRALSILDFSTVQKYSSISLVANTYSGYFSDSSLGNSSYYSQFLRKVYKFALTSLEIESVGNTAVFANGTSIVTVKLKMLDLTDKDFWLEDRDEIFDNLKSLYVNENDSAKAQQYLYDYVYSAYENGKVGKRDITVEIKLDKVSLGGWLISDDTDLNSALCYENGLNVAQYILEEYNKWYEDQMY